MFVVNMYHTNSIEDQCEAARKTRNTFVWYGLCTKIYDHNTICPSVCSNFGLSYIGERSNVEALPAYSVKCAHWFS